MTPAEANKIISEYTRVKICEEGYSLTLTTSIGVNRNDIIDAMGRLLIAAGFSVKGDLVIEDNSDCD